MWFNRDGVANIISMENFTKKLPIDYDSSAGDNFILHKDSKQIIFNWIPLGIYFHDARASDIIMAGTTKENCKGYTSRKIVAANKARTGLTTVGNKSAGEYINMISSGFIRNCPITPQAVTIANKSFGPDIAELKGKK